MISAERVPAGVDTERFRLRKFVEALECRISSNGTTNRSASPRSRPSSRAIRAPCSSTTSAPTVNRCRQRAGSRARMARAFGVPPEKLLAEIMRRLRRKPEFIELTSAQAPVHEVILTGKDADVTKLPVHFSTDATAVPTSRPRSTSRSTGHRLA